MDEQADIHAIKLSGTRTHCPHVEALPCVDTKHTGVSAVRQMSAGTLLCQQCSVAPFEPV